jgi:hypothetical protein
MAGFPRFAFSGSIARAKRSDEHLHVTHNGNRPRLHHIIPQVLLRHFADKRSRVRVVPKWGRAPRLQHIKKVSVVSHANTLQTDGGRDYSLETVLSKIEGHFPRIVALLDQATRTPEEDSWVLSLVVTQAARDPYLRLGFIGEEVENIFAALRYALRDADP